MLPKEKIERQQVIWGPLSTTLWGTFIIVLYIITQAAVVFYIMSRGKFSPMHAPTAVLRLLKYNGFVLSWCTFASTIVCGLATIVIVKLKRHANLRHYLGLVLPTRTQFFWWFVAVVASIAFWNGISVSGEIPDSSLRTYSSLRSPWILWLALIFFAPLFEELFFRGFLIPGLSASALHSYGAVIISSAAWAMIHLQYDIRIIGIIFIDGLILGTARIATGSTILTMLLHSFTNLVAIVDIAIRLQRLFA